MASMLDYGFNSYYVTNYIKKDTKVGVIKNDKSSIGKVDIVPTEDIKILNKKGSKKRKLEYKLRINKYELPIEKGDLVASIDIYENSKKIYSIGATVDKELKKANLLELMIRNFKEVCNGDNFF